MSANTSLAYFFRKQLLGTSLYPVLIVAVLMLSVYFFVFSYISARNKEAMLDQAHQYLHYATKKEAAHIESKLEKIANDLIHIHNRIEHFYTHRSDYNQPNPNLKFATDKNGVFYKAQNNGGSDAVYMPGVAITPERKDAILRMEWFDLPMKSVVENNSDVVAAWFIQHDNLVRYYPPVDFHAIVEPTWNPQEFSFYYEANRKNNPDKKALWSSVYLDPALQGWLTSRIAPIYENNIFHGVVGIDVPINSLAKHTLELDMPWQGKAFLTNDSGLVLAMEPDLQHFLNLIHLKKDNEAKGITKEILKPSEHNLLTLSDHELSRQFAPFFKTDTASGRLIYKDHRFLIRQEPISDIGWRVFFLIDENAVLAPALASESFSFTIGLISTAVLLLLILLYFFIILYRTKNVARLISEPITTLAKSTQDIDHFEGLANTHILEIDALFKNFNTMASAVRLHQQSLEARIAERTKELEEKNSALEQLSVTDSLSTLFNRRKIDEQLQSELYRSQRFERPLSIAFLDIDYFKHVNDTYGHQLGDQVIMEFAAILKSNTRNSDHVGRWGGEEFLIVSPETDEAGIFKLAHLLKAKIEHYNFPIKEPLTASIGIATSTKDDNIVSLIKRADSALYRAKNGGRNRIEN